MAEFEIYSEENHPEKSADVITKAKAAYGFVPNLMGALSEAPAVAQAYMDLAAAIGNSSFTLEERHVAWFTINTYHGCDYCMAAHTATAKRQKISDDVIEAARNRDADRLSAGYPPDSEDNRRWHPAGVGCPGFSMRFRIAPAPVQV